MLVLSSSFSFCGEVGLTRLSRLSCREELLDDIVDSSSNSVGVSFVGVAFEVVSIPGGCTGNRIFVGVIWGVWFAEDSTANDGCVSRGCGFEGGGGGGGSGVKSD